MTRGDLELPWMVGDCWPTVRMPPPLAGRPGYRRTLMPSGTLIGVLLGRTCIEITVLTLFDTVLTFEQDEG